MDVVTMVRQKSNHHIQAVMNNLKFFTLLDCENLGFWTDVEIFVTSP